MTAKVTAIIPTYNEEQHIAQAIKSVDWADEIIVVDSFSTDRTVTIATKNPKVKLIQHEYQNSAAQKNWIIPQATHEWVFILDADERVTDDLKTEIHHTLNNPTKSAYWIYRRNFFLGKELKFIWKNDKVIRLFKKADYKYKSLAVHAKIEVHDPNLVGVMKYKLLHYTYKNTRHFLAKMETYAEWSAKDHDSNVKNVNIFYLFIKPISRFIKHYFVQLGFLDGYRGFIVSVLMSWGVFLRYVKMIELRRNSAKQ
ncbi:MAG: glycosyltransferase family 2 protein [Saprospiraceae bacterium]